MNTSKSSGLGDTVAKFTAALKIDKAVSSAAKAMGKGDCGCKQRQELLNQKFPYKK